MSRPGYQSINDLPTQIPINSPHPPVLRTPPNHSTPLLSPPLDPRMLGSIPTRRAGSASFLSCVANLSNTILGTGMLAMAHGFAQGGLILGFLTVIVCGLMALLGLYLLALCACHPSVPHRAASFSAIAKVTYPKAAVAFDAAIAVKCFGVSISYLLIFGKLMPQVVLSFQSTDPENLSSSVLLDRRLWITLSMLVLVPVSFLKTLDSLRYVSYIALVGVVDLVIVAVSKFFDAPPIPDGPDQPRWIKLDSNFVTVLPVFVFAYTCAQNLFPVHNEMVNNSPKRMKEVLMTCMGSAVGVYEVVGVMGYLTFGSKVSSNLISDYGQSRFLALSRLAISFLVLFSYPLQLHPCRASLEKVVIAFRREGRQGEEEEEEETTIARYVGMTAGLLLASFLIAVNVERLETVLGFVGSTGSTTISYILPSLFFLKLFPAHLDTSLRSRAGEESDCTEEEGPPTQTQERENLLRLRTGAKALLVVGCVVMGVCFSLNVREAFFVDDVVVKD